ncbi:MAG TPA: glycosyltransferase [Nocardioides sp.]|uniref:glycosyltransferase n=1 Tax=Nocardioides sp. TaxID=35761 RepID=UPI002EDB4C0E
MRVLLSAYACDPVEGSEPGVGWAVLQGARSWSGEVTLVTRTNNVAAIEGALGPTSGVRVIGLDLPSWLMRLKHMLPWGHTLYYALWQLRLAHFLSTRLRHEAFDVVHHVTFASDWLPAGVLRLPGTAMKVWGPVGGASVCPVRLYPYLGARGVCTEILRRFTGGLGRWLLGRRNARVSDRVVAQNPDVAGYFSSVAVRMFVEPNAFIPYSLVAPSSHASTEPGIIVGVGRLMPWKGWALALRSLTHLPSHYRLRLYGRGPDEARLRRLVERLGIDGRVEFMGHVPRAEVVQAVCSAEVIVFPSFHDSAPGVVGEAIALGKPLVTLDLAGAGYMAKLAGVEPVPHRGGELARRFADAIRAPASPTDHARFNSERVRALVGEWYGIGQTGA